MLLTHYRNDQIRDRLLNLQNKLVLTLLQIVHIHQGARLHQTCLALGFEVMWKEYEDGGHWIHPQHGVNDMAAFLAQVLVK